MDDLVERLRTRAHIRRTLRAKEGPHEDKIANLCDEAANKIDVLSNALWKACGDDKDMAQTYIDSQTNDE